MTATSCRPRALDERPASKTSRQDLCYVPAGRLAKLAGRSAKVQWRKAFMAKVYSIMVLQLAIAVLISVSMMMFGGSST